MRTTGLGTWGAQRAQRPKVSEQGEPRRARHWRRAEARARRDRLVWAVWLSVRPSFVSLSAVIAPVARDKSSWGNKAENGDEEGSRAVDITAHPSPAPPRRSVWRMLFCFRFPTARGGAVVVPGLP